MTAVKAPDTYDGHDVEYNGKADVVVDLRQPGNPTVLVRKDGGGADGDFREGTVAVRTRNGVLVIAAMDLENQECFDVTYRVGGPEKRVVAAPDYGTITVDDNERDIGVVGFVAGNSTVLRDIASDSYGSEKRRSKATGGQAVRVVALTVDKEG